MRVQRCGRLAPGDRQGRPDRDGRVVRRGDGDPERREGPSPPSSPSSSPADPATPRSARAQAPRDVGSQQLAIQLPSGTTCTGGADGNTCLVQFVTAGRFGNCVPVQIGSAANSTAAAASNGTAAAATGNSTAAAAAGDNAAATTGTAAAATGKKTKGKKTQAQAAAAAAKASRFSKFVEEQRNRSRAYVSTPSVSQDLSSCVSAFPARYVLRRANASARAQGSRAAAIARRAAERPAVEVLA